MGRPAVVTLVLVVLAAGCGGDGEGERAGATTAAAPPDAKAVFVEQADAVCRRVNRRGAALNAQATRIQQEATSAPAALAALEPIMREAVTRSREARDALAALDVPPGDEPAVARILEAYGEQTELLDAVADAATARDAAAFKVRSGAVARVAGRARAMARAYGFRVCGQGVAGR